MESLVSKERECDWFSSVNALCRFGSIGSIEETKADFEFDVCVEFGGLEVVTVVLHFGRMFEEVAVEIRSERIEGIVSGLNFLSGLETVAMLGVVVGNKLEFGTAVEPDSELEFN